MTALAESRAQTVGVKVACAALNVPRSRIYRARQPRLTSPPRSAPRRALSEAERAQVRQTLNRECFADRAPRQVYAALLDGGQYLCSWRTM